jgi:hypothetical protein
VTANVRVTGSAAAYVALPVCDAVREHVPVATKVTVVPATVQTLVVLEEIVTERPLDAVAVAVTGPWFTAMSAGCANVIACVSGTAVTWKDFETGVAAAYVALPACEAVTVHVPVATSVTLVPETVQTAVVELAKPTASPLDALALSDTGP